jgi:transposase
MSKPLSMDLRERAIAAYERGEGTQAEVAELFGIGEATLRRWLRRARETGSVAPITDYPHGPSPKIEHANLLVLEELMRETPDATNAELAERMEARTGISVSAATISRAVNILGWTRKKSSSSPEKPKPRILGIFVRAGEPGNGR